MNYKCLDSRLLRSLSLSSMVLVLVSACVNVCVLCLQKWTHTEARTCIHWAIERRMCIVHVCVRMFEVYIRKPWFYVQGASKCIMCARTTFNAFRLLHLPRKKSVEKIFLIFLLSSLSNEPTIYIPFTFGHSPADHRFRASEHFNRN